jgi:hypothetical protein
MPAGPRRSLQRERAKFGLNLIALSCLAFGILVAAFLVLLNVSPIFALAIGVGITASLGLTFGQGPEKILKALYKPQKRIRGFLPNEKFRN